MLLRTITRGESNLCSFPFELSPHHMNALHSYQERAAGVQVSRIEIKGNAHTHTQQQKELLVNVYALCGLRERKINILR
jgi:hypothetical protein